MTTSSASKSPSSPLVTINAPTTMQTSVTSVSSVMSSVSSVMSTPLVSTVSSSSPNNNNSNNNKHSSVKCENSYVNNSNTSCNNENTNSQTLDDNNHKIIMKPNRSGNGPCKIVNIVANHERDASTNGVLSNTIRQNTTNINNCSIQYREPSPNNNGNNRDLSNTPNATLQTKYENITNDEEKKTIIKEEDREKPNNSTSSTTSISSISSNTNFASLSSTTTNSLTTSASCTNKNLTNMEEDKSVAIKEEHNISPNMSPVGFSCSIDQGSHNNVLIPETTVSNAKLNDVTNDKNDSKVHILSNIGTNSNANTNSNEESNNNNNNINQTSTVSVHNASHTYNSNASGMISLNNNNSGGTIGAGNCVDYMQHQNHIFVFSTQLANKSADAVLNGQFPTIIAYHCTQPSTKTFLEDFFLKNSMKMTKLQRQNTLNMCNMSIGNSGELLGGQLWLNTLPKMPQKLSTNKNGDECDILPWDQTRTDVDLPSSGDRNSINSMENSEIVRNNGTNSKSLVVNELDSNSIPSLQGTKVPDENLTPQQRQHRVEQLAKLKKIGLNLFPENDNTEFRSEIAPGQTRKMPVDNIGGAATNPMIQMTTTISPSCNTTANKNSVHNNNIMKTEGMSALVDAVTSMPSDIIGSTELPMLSQYGSNKASSNVHLNNTIPCALTNSMGININNIVPNLSITSSLNNMPNAPMNNMGNMAKNSTIGNMHTSAMGSMSGNNNGINDENGRCANINSDVSAGFASNFSTAIGETNSILETDVNHKHITVGNNDHQSVDGTSETGNLSQMEWSTLQQQFYGERLKSNMPDGVCNVVPSPSSTSRTNSSSINLNARLNNTLSVSSNLNNHRPIQGPPPPYHQSTANQRPASVPITSQSPNPASPNNPTSNLSLPSPRTSSIMGMTNNSPNMDGNTVATVAVSSSSSTPNSVALAVVSGSGSGGNGCVSSNCVNNITKVNFSQDGSPSNNQTTNLITGGSTNTICNRSNNTTTLNNYPNAEISPKELDTSNLTSSSADISKMESTFPNSGLICPGGMGSGASNANASNNFKNQASGLERQNIVQMASQFNRRTDNIPLNPNNNRMLQNKMINSFDPISSLAQMSQQLTGCVGGLGNSPNNMGILGSTGGNGAGGMNEMPSGINIDGSMGPMDPAMDHCGTSGGGNIGISVTGCGISPTVSFASNNCHIMGPMPQRLMNSKMCGPGGAISSFNGSSMGIKGDHSTFSGIIPTHRMANHHRMSSNFGSFNMAPNIQVKASTPNTIQYLPVRTQSNSTNNIRMPPSLEFLQRYTNPQLMGAALGGGPTPCTMENSSIGNQMGSQNEMNKLSSTNNIGVNMNQGNFFGTCHSLNSMSSMPEQDELQGGGVVSSNNNNIGNGGIISSHDMQIGPQGTLLRGLRPMRQTCINQGGGMVPTGPRMQHPIMGGGKRPPSTGPTSMIPFHSNGTESMDIADQTPQIFNNTVVNSPGSMQGYQQKSGNKLLRDNGASLNSANNNGNNGPQNGLLPSDPPSLQSSVLPGSISGGRSGLNSSNILSNSLNMNGSVISSGCAPGSPMNYKSFVGPTSNDIKYAQQFHSFQQQLYATSVRGQQPGNVSSALHASNNNSNASFFVNK